MLTLSDASYDTKEVLKWGGLVLAGLVVLIVLLRMFFIVKEMIFPTPPPKPTVLFGKLAPQTFPQNATAQKLTYSINTLSGAFPGFPDQIKVFTTVTNSIDLLSLKRATNLVANQGFTANQTQLSSALYQWDKAGDNLGRKIAIDIVNNNFSVTSNFLSNQSILSGQNLPSQDNAIGDAQNFFGSLNSLPKTLDSTKTKATLLTIKNNSFIPATSPSQAQIIRVDFFQQDIDTLPIFYENPNSSNINAYVAGGDYGNQVVAANYIYQVINDNFSTYPIKTAQAAFEDLQKGNGYIASFNSSSTDVAINDVTLGYYIGSQKQSFVMPIFVFKDDKGFVGYVPAITDGWINK